MEVIMKHSSLLTFALALMLLLTTAQAKKNGGPGPGSPKGLKGMHPAVMAELNLTAEQQSKIQNHKVTQRKEMIDLRAEKQKLEIDLKEQLGANTLDKAAIQTIRTKLVAVETKLIDHHINGMVFFMETLTQEQRAQFKTLMQNRPRNKSDNSGKKSNKGSGKKGYKN
jgi:Spy/CpxP family protein refolding chaperone